jgi:excisionase family DNA binding protein
MLSDPQFILSMPETWPPLLTIYQVAKILNMSPWTLRQWDKQGKLQAIRIGNRRDRRYRREIIISILSEGL